MWRGLLGQGKETASKQKAELEHECFHGVWSWFNLRGTSAGLIVIDNSGRIKIQYAAASLGGGCEWLGENSNRWTSINKHYPRLVSSQIIQWQQGPNVFFLFVFVFFHAGRRAESRRLWRNVIGADLKWYRHAGRLRRSRKWGDLMVIAMHSCRREGVGGALPLQRYRCCRLAIGSVQKWPSFEVLFSPFTISLCREMHLNGGRAIFWKWLLCSVDNVPGHLFFFSLKLMPTCFLLLFCFIPNALFRVCRY